MALSAQVTLYCLPLYSTIPLWALPQKYCCQYPHLVWLAFGRGHHSRSEKARREGLRWGTIQEHAVFGTCVNNRRCSTRGPPPVRATCVATDAGCRGRRLLEVTC